MKDKTCKKKCGICGSCDWSVLYEGPIRVGRFGNLSETNHLVYRCGHCGVGFFDQPALNYELPDYHQMVKVDNSSPEKQTVDEAEQVEKFNALDEDGLSSKVITDIGCGHGHFLNFIKDKAKEIIAVEPSQSLQLKLKDNGYNVYSYCQEALKDWRGLVDIAVSFAVLEHLDNPVEFLKEIKALLKPGGTLLLSTPNCENWLIKFLPESYASFFYRYVHRWYFNKDSLEFISKAAGFREVEIKFVQRFDVSNALFWIKSSRPTGLSKTKLFRGLDNQYRHFIEAKGRSDFVYARMHI